MRGTRSVKESFRLCAHARSDKREFFFPICQPPCSREKTRCAILPISSLLAMLDTIPVLKTPFKESFQLCAVHTWSVKESFKESFSNMSAPMFSRENARCAILPISSLLAMLDTPVLKTPFKESFRLCTAHGVLKRVFKESFSNMSAPMISRENARCAILPISSLLAMLDTIPVLKKLPLKRVFGYARHSRVLKRV